MGPITLFDKSFLQSLSIDESVWFDHFFLTNICPIFYVETLADLKKTARKGKTQEEEVSIIAEKFPQMHGTPCAYHLQLCTSNLLGSEVPINNQQIPVSGGRLVKAQGESGVVYNKLPENEAFFRWANKEFLDVEHKFAQHWRAQLAALNLDEWSKISEILNIDNPHCKTLEEAKLSAENVLNICKHFDLIKLAFCVLRINDQAIQRDMVCP